MRSPDHGYRPRVVIADSSAHAPAIRRSLEDAGLPVLGVAPDVEGVLALTVTGRADVCLVDVALPGGGVMAAARLAGCRPRPQVVMLSETHHDEALFASLRAGVAGYFLKDGCYTRLPHVVEDVMAGHVALPRGIVRCVVDEFARRAPSQRPLVRVPGVQRLSRREHEVLAAVAEGMDTAQIAEVMFLEESTVRSYVSRALRKLHLRDRDALRQVIGG